MAKLPTYKPLTVVPSEGAPDPEREGEGAELEQPGEAHLLTDVAHHFMVYIHHDAYKALCRYALEQTGPRNKTKPHDLMVEALEAWFASHGMSHVPVRAKPRDRATRKIVSPRAKG